jgi:hypothetical protein
MSMRIVGLARRAVPRTMLCALAAGAVALAAVAPAQAAGGPGGGGEETTLTNNLSYPVIWSDGAALALPGEFGKPVLPAEKAVPYTDPVTEETFDVWKQAEEGVSWQAQNEVALAPADVSEVDWGDNLEAKSLSPGKPVRVETTLLKNLESPMTAFNMVSLEGEQREEVFATPGTTYESSQATMYSACARLTIQRLQISREDPYLSLLKWDAASGQWTGKDLVAAPVFEGGVWESAGEGSGYTAEVNGSGKVIYGYNWRTSGLAAGDYRITFSLAAECPAAVLNTHITEATKVLFSEEESVAPLVSGSGGSGGSGSGSGGSGGGAAGGGVPQIDATDNLTYVDVELGNPSYTPYVPPAPETETKTVTPTTTTTTTSVTTSKTQSQTREKEQARTRAHVKVSLHLKKRHRTREHVEYQFSGTVSPPRNGQKLRIQLRTQYGWRTVAIAKLTRQNATTSRYSITLRKPKAGTYRAMMVSNDKYMTGLSANLRLRLG